MGQITTGIRSILNHPVIYDSSQRFVGREQQGLADFVRDFVRPRPGDKVLDIGCGTAKIIDFLSGVSYWGFDPSPAYIKQARKIYGSAGIFFCKELTREDLDALPAFDIVLMIGVLHHLDDKTAGVMLRLAHQALKPGGRLITIDACFIPRQNPIARCLISWDRGQNVRAQEGYSQLVAGIFPAPRVEIRHRRWIPWTYCAMECART